MYSLNDYGALLDIYKSRLNNRPMRMGYYILFLTFFLGSTELLACSVCGMDALGERTGNAYLASLLFMMSVPTLLIGSIGIWVYLRFGRKTKPQG